MQLFIAGRVLDYDNGACEFRGVFSTAEAAAAACNTIDDFVGPATLDEPLPDELSWWPGVFYPLLSGQPVPCPTSPPVRNTNAS